MANIKNVVFDFGQVLVHFRPRKMVEKYVSDAQDVEALIPVVFDRAYWDRLDAGTITEEEVMDGYRQRLPERLWEKAEEIFSHWMENIPEIDGMAALVGLLKENGVPLFLLSNISKSFAARADEFPVLHLFEKKIFSAVCGMVKPSREIFEYLCSTCGIAPEETLFIDDSQKNIDGARSVGIHGYLFDGDVAALREYLRGLGLLTGSEA